MADNNDHPRPRAGVPPTHVCSHQKDGDSSGVLCRKEERMAVLPGAFDQPDLVLADPVGWSTGRGDGHGWKMGFICPDHPCCPPPVAGDPAGVAAPARTTASDEHPTPWRWRDFPDGSTALMDAAGEHVLTAEVGEAPDDEENAWVVPSSSYVRAVTEAAGEMHALVLAMVEELWAVSKLVPDHELLRSHLKQGSVGRARELLARIAERAKGGT